MCSSPLAADPNAQTSRRQKPPRDAGGANAPAQLAALVEEFFERELELNPLLATSIGDERYNDRLANSLGPEYRAHNQEYLGRLLHPGTERIDHHVGLYCAQSPLNRRQQ